MLHKLNARRLQALIAFQHTTEHGKTLWVVMKIISGGQLGRIELTRRWRNVVFPLRGFFPLFVSTPQKASISAQVKDCRQLWASGEENNENSILGD
ncbi:hypothetical protein BaRGS_00001479 [Batillaria attramentaria]|uniref:Uncharacterized protein n=1 Tax=Batillaria attramentaria TaxID=370345 RepID=A0ABD0M6F9_9CAEN